MWRHKRIWLPALAALLGVNVWAWWPGGQAAVPPPAPVGGGPIPARGDFEIRGLPSETRTRVARNLFQIRSAERPGAPSSSRPQPVAAAQQPVAPPPGTGPAAGIGTLDQFRLTGWVMRNGRRTAFLIKGTETFVVAEGERLDQRYTVEKIDQDGVTVTDSVTAAMARIPSSGF